MFVLYLVFRGVLPVAQPAAEAPAPGAMKHLDTGIPVAAVAA